MKYILIPVGLLIASASLCAGQSKNAETRAISQSADTAGETIRVEYETRPPKPDRPPAYLVNGSFFKLPPPYIKPDEITNLQVLKRDTVIAGKKYYGMILITVKHFHPSGYLADMISLNALKETYTTLKNDPALFTIDGKLINQDYHNYRIDKNRILKIIVEPFTGSGNGQPSWLVNILTKTKENIKNDGRIILRGTTSQAGI